MQMGLDDIVGKGKAEKGLVVRLGMAMEEKERMEKVEGEGTVVAAAAKGRRTLLKTVAHSDDVHTR